MLSKIKDSLFLVYQPILDGAGQFSKCEALMRWDREKLDCSPQDLIDWAEEDKQAILEIDMLVLKRLAGDLLVFSKNDIDLNSIRFAINVSPTTLGINDQYIKTVNSLLEGIPENLLEMEILESKISDECRTRVKSALQELRRMGFTLAIDDFGGGFDSIQKITEIDYSNLKIDGSLINNIESCQSTRLVVQTVTELAHKLNKTVTAEKIEHKAQYEILKEAGCDFFQGFYFSKPLHIEDFIQFINKKTKQK